MRPWGMDMLRAPNDKLKWTQNDEIQLYLGLRAYNPSIPKMSRINWQKL